MAMRAVLSRHTGVNQVEQVRTYDDLKSLVYEHVRHLLENNFEQLCQLLYRIDVPEQCLAEALELSTHERVAKRLTDDILKREYQKYASREAYKQSKKDS